MGSVITWDSPKGKISITLENLWHRFGWINIKTEVPSTRMRPILTGITTLLLAASYKLLPSFIADHSRVDKLAELELASTYATQIDFDFIVVGGGSSGALVANRLSRNFKTLLLEAGGVPFPLQNIPQMAPLLIGHKELDWGYYTIPQKASCLSLNNQSSYWPRGKGLGGTSLLNFMAWNRGHHFDYDNWAAITGDVRWSYDRILPFFKLSERFTGEGDNLYHGYDGDIFISPVPYKPLARYFLDAASELGHAISDLNAPFDEAFNEHFFNNNNGRRHSSYDAFIRPIQYKRPKTLFIRKYAYVTRVLMDKYNRAVGVEYEQGGKFFNAFAQKEVILSAGAINSPKILMHSGIGPAEHLLEVGIPPVVNLPGVGRNLQDHISALVGPFSLKRQKLTYIPTRDSRPTDAFDYMALGDGPLVQTGSMASGFFMSNNVSAEGRIWPDVQLLLLALPLDNDGLNTLAKVFNLDQKVARQYYGQVLNQDAFSIMTIVSRPKSRGNIRLVSNSPFDYPLIDPKYLAHPSDIKVLLKGISKAVELVEGTEAFAEIGAKLAKKPFPPCKKHKPRSDRYWECFARHYSVSVYHPSGTCSMGKIENEYTVVDSSLRVKGVKSLRVIDASIMPSIVSSNINPACTLIAEVGSYMILSDYVR